MKRFDKGYIYSSLLSDAFYSLVTMFVFLEELLFTDDGELRNITSNIPIFIVAFILIYSCFIAYRIMYYRTSGYELTETEIKCNKGVLFRKRSVLEYSKIHAINKKQSIFHRIFGIAVLTVDSGSTNTSHQAEITIIEKSQVVDSLVAELNSLKENGVRGSERDSAEESVLLSESDSLYNFTSKKKMLYTLINVASMAFFIALIGALAIIVIGVCKLMLQLDYLGTWGQYFLYAVLITVGAMLLSSFFVLIGCLIFSFVQYYKFTITKRGNNIEISYGLLEKHTNTFSYDRIKAVKVQQGIVQRLLGFASINLEVIGYTVDSGNDNNTGIGVLVPFCKYDEVGEILARVLPGYTPDEKQTSSVRFFPFVSWFLLIFGAISGLALSLTVAIMLIFSVSAPIILSVTLSALVAIAALIAVKLLSGFFAYKTNGIAANDGKITVYSGGFTRKVTVFTVKDLIAVEDVTTPLRKKAGITSLVLHLRTNAASNEVKVHIQKDSLTEELEKLLKV